MLQPSTGDGTVAVYRWFENGEGWAYHPWYGSRGLELSRAVDPILKGRPTGPFCVPALGGFLIGEHRDDPHCPDPKARERRPTVLSAAFLSFQPSERDTDRLLEALRRLPPIAERREDASLALDAELCRELAQRYALPATPRRDASGDADLDRSSGWGRTWKLVTMVAGLLLLGGGAVYVIGQRSERAASVQPTDKKPESLANRQPAPRPISSEDEAVGLSLLTAARFREALGAYARVDHPYSAYLKFQASRLPETTAAYLPDERTSLLLHHESLFSGIDHAQVVRAKEDGLTRDLLRALAYDEWRAKAGAREYLDRDKPLPEALRRFVEQFRQPPPELERAAVQMAEMLQAWGESEPSTAFAQRYPFAVIDRFFAFLTRPTFAPRPLALDHPKAAFLWRLPADPIGEGLTYENEEELARSLRRLLQDLERDFNPFDNTEHVPVLLQRIATSMRYRDWLRREGMRSYADGTKDPGGEVNQFVGRFER
jgi:hypothetical protein